MSLSRLWLIPVCLTLSALAPNTVAAKDPPKSPGKGPKAAAATKAEVIARAMKRLDLDSYTSDRDMNEQHKIFTLSIAGLDFLLDPAGGKGAAHADRIEHCVEAIGQYVEGAARFCEGGGAGPSKGGDDMMSAMEWSQTTWALS